MFGHTTAGLFGYTHLTGGYPGGQAEYVRVPFADTAPSRSRTAHGRAGAVPRRHFPDRLAGRRQCDIQPSDTVAVWGCGPVGQITIRSAVLLGAEQVIAIDRVPERLMARSRRDHDQFEKESVVERLNELTDGKGPEKCIDAVGLEATSRQPDRSPTG